MTFRSHRRAGPIIASTVAVLVMAACAAPTGSPSPDAPTAPRPTRPAVPGGGAFPGDVSAGEVRWGAAIQGNGDPGRHETVTRRPLGVRRTYFQWNQRTTGMVRTAAEDVAAGRLPWVSVKPPSWGDVGAGRHDAEIDQMLVALDRVGGPVWLTVHHEPEGGGGRNAADDPGGPAAWRAMQQRIRVRMDAVGTRNVAFAPVLMAWTFDPRSGRNAEDWWVDGVWDFAGIDYYVDTEAPDDVAMAQRQWLLARSFYGDRRLDLAVGEWGNRGTDGRAAAEMRGFYDHALGSADDGLGARVIALAYFDSNLNSPTGGWMLSGEPLHAFRELAARPTSVVAS